MLLKHPFLQFQFFSLFQSYDSSITLKILVKRLSPSFYLPAPNSLLNSLRNSISLTFGLVFVLKSWYASSFFFFLLLLLLHFGKRWFVHWESPNIKVELGSRRLGVETIKSPSYFFLRSRMIIEHCF